jgi:hypothetical protein
MKVQQASLETAMHKMCPRGYQYVSSFVGSNTPETTTAENIADQRS